MDVHDPRPPEDSGLVVRDLAVNYGPVLALRGVSLNVPRGSIVTVLGGNGAGKSTLLRAVSGTLRFQRGGITAGEISFDRVRLSGAAASAVVAGGVVQVPEGRRVFARMTVEENLRARARST
ncbi:ATP-binding cassette domain-containing protein [Streptosporangium lutulentum]